SAEAASKRMSGPRTCVGTQQDNKKPRCRARGGFKLDGGRHAQADKPAEDEVPRGQANDLNH
ncbi:MAG TPA: hypothetical protein VK864_08360, partial [Longimicrobiales bacterium]|nr:hypothetical protein [Longimicrobiales bacterium]